MLINSKLMSLFRATLLLILIGAPVSAASQDRSDQLNRPVRVLLSGITQQLVSEVRAIDADERIEFSYPSNNLSDFDSLLILVDEQQDAFDHDLFAQFGFEKSLLAEKGEHPFVSVVSIELEGIEEHFLVYVVDRRQFFARDTACHAPFLKELILSLDWNNTIQEQSNYFLASDCERRFGP